MHNVAGSGHIVRLTTNVCLFSNQTKFNHSKFIAYFRETSARKGEDDLQCLYYSWILRTRAKDFGDLVFLRFHFVWLLVVLVGDFVVEYACYCVFPCWLCKSPKASANWLGDKCICQSFNLCPAPSISEYKSWSLSSHAFLLGETPIVFIDFVSAAPLFRSPCADLLMASYLMVYWAGSQTSVTNKLAAYNSLTFSCQSTQVFVVRKKNWELSK